MARYILVDIAQVPPGATALLLFVYQRQLCAGTLERQGDGRIVRRVAEKPCPRDIVSVISGLMQGQADIDLHVVLEADAYWPEAFPALTVEGEIKDRFSEDKYRADHRSFGNQKRR